ncbi:MAG: chorismate mutase, partial [Ignavibacteriaceae bacterium]
MNNIFNKKENDFDSWPESEKQKVLEKLRDEINGLDNKIVKLINKRTLKSVLIGKIKKTLGLSLYDPQRE